MTNCTFSQHKKCDFLIRLLCKIQIAHDELSQLLDERCCDVNDTNSSGMSPIKAAIMNGDVKTIQILIEKGALITKEHFDFADKSYPHKGDI